MKRRDFLFTVAASLAAGVTSRAAEAEPLRLTHTIESGHEAELRVYQPE